MGDKRQLVLFVLIFVALLGAVGTLTYFKLRQYKECEKEIASLEEERDQAQRLIDQIPLLRQEAKALSEQIEIYAEILPKEHEVRHDAFVETMDRFARETGLQILRADPFERKEPAGARTVNPGAPNQPTESKPPFSEHSYLFELVGPFPSFLRFVNKLENWDRFLAVEEIDIRPLGASNTASTSGKANDKEIEEAQKEAKSIQLVVTTYTHRPKETLEVAGQDL